MSKQPNPTKQIKHAFTLLNNAPEHTKAQSILNKIHNDYDSVWNFDRSSLNDQTFSEALWWLSFKPSLFQRRVLESFTIDTWLKVLQCAVAIRNLKDYTGSLEFLQNFAKLKKVRKALVSLYQDPSLPSYLGPIIEEIVLPFAHLDTQVTECLGSVADVEWFPPSDLGWPLSHGFGTGSSFQCLQEKGQSIDLYNGKAVLGAARSGHGNYRKTALEALKWHSHLPPVKNYLLSILFPGPAIDDHVGVTFEMQGIALGSLIGTASIYDDELDEVFSRVKKNYPGPLSMLCDRAIKRKQNRLKDAPHAK
jgi:hypothetical protein